jgi:hypothetical protein
MKQIASRNDMLPQMPVDFKWTTKQLYPRTQNSSKSGMNMGNIIPGLGTVSEPQGTSGL